MPVEPDLKDIAERVTKLETWKDDTATKIDKMSGGWWDGFEKFIQNHPKLATTVTALLVSGATWAMTYFSVPATREVPGPERVIERKVEVPAKAEPAGKAKADTVEGVKQ